MSEMFDFKNYQWRKMAKNGEKRRKMAMANLPFSFVKFAISPLAPPPPHQWGVATQKKPKKTVPNLKFAVAFGFFRFFSVFFGFFSAFFGFFGFCGTFSVFFGLKFDKKFQSFKNHVNNEVLGGQE